MNPQTPYDLTRITLLVLIIGVLIAGSLWTLLPFLGALILGRGLGGGDLAIALGKGTAPRSAGADPSPRR